MRRLSALIILGVLACAIPARAASTSSDWPGLNADAAQTNSNPVERGITRANALKLSVKWSVPMAAQSYPVVAGNRVYLPVPVRAKVHVDILDPSNGKKTGTVFKDASGGLLVSNHVLWLAGHTLQAVDLSTGQRLAQIKAKAAAKGTVFLNPQSDGKYVLAGYAAGTKGSILTIDLTTNTIVRTMPSTSAMAVLVTGHVVTRGQTGSVFYDESTGQPVAHATYIGSNWFASSEDAFTVATGSTRHTSIFAFDGTGQYLWSHRVGPALATQGADWPHAVSPTAIYAQMLTPRPGIVALDPLSGRVLWKRGLANVQSMVWANGLLFVLTYNLGLPVHVVVLNAQTGKPWGQLNFSAGFFAFPAQNEMMVANGMLFLRLEGPSGSELVALGH